MIRIVQSFTGYPDGEPRHFIVDDTPDDLGADYEALLIEKGHAVPATPTPTTTSLPKNKVTDETR